MDDAGFTSQDPLHSRLTVPVEFVVGKVGVEQYFVQYPASCSPYQKFRKCPVPTHHSY
jgi:hypothetical protein